MYKRLKWWFRYVSPWFIILYVLITIFFWLMASLMSLPKISNAPTLLEAFIWPWWFLTQLRLF